MSIKLNLQPADFDLVVAIANRADREHVLGRDLDGVTRPKVELLMDLCAVHNSNPLKLADLLAANTFDFMHDIAGIIRHLDRTTGELRDCFSPRYSA